MRLALSALLNKGSSFVISLGRPDRCLVLLVASFLLLRLSLFSFNYVEWGDSFDFFTNARSILHATYPLDAKRLPVFPIFVAVGLPFFGELFWSRIVVLGFSAGVLALTFKLTNWLSGDRGAALLASALVLVNPIFLYWSLRPMSDVSFTLFVLLALYRLVRYRPGVWSEAVLLGLAIGLAAMTRFEGFLLVPIAGTALIFRRETPRGLTLCTLTFTCAVAPWYVRNLLLFGSVLHTGYVGYNADYDLTLRMVYILNLLLAIGVPAGLAWVAAGIAGISNRFSRSVIMAYLVAHLGFVAVWHPHARYFMPVIPVLSMFLAIGLLTTVRYHLLAIGLAAAGALFFVLGASHYSQDFIRTMSTGGKLAVAIPSLLSVVVMTVAGVVRRARVTQLALISLVFPSLLLAGLFAIAHDRPNYFPVYQAIQFLVDEDGRVAYGTEIGVLAWYLGERGYLLDESLDETAQRQWMREHDIRFLIWTNVAPSRPDRLTLVRDKACSDGFELMQSFVRRETDHVRNLLGAVGLYGPGFRPEWETWKADVYAVAGLTPNCVEGGPDD